MSSGSSKDILGLRILHVLADVEVPYADYLCKESNEISALEGNMLGASPKLVMREKNRGVGEEGGKSEGKGKEG